MEKSLILTILLLSNFLLNAQEEDRLLRKGTVQYKKNAFDRSLPPFKQAVELNPENPVSHYNLGNAYFRNKNYPESVEAFDHTIVNTEDKAFKEKAYYNKGVALTKQKKLRESIVAYKSALRLDPSDEDARHNLQKALHELQQQSKPDENQPKEEKQQEKSRQQEKPKEQQSKLNKRQVENLLKALQQKEQQVQKKVQQAKSRSASQQEKDW